LRRYAAIRKYAGTIPDEEIRIFIFPNHSNNIMALRWTRAAREISARTLPRSKGLRVRKK
jgi:hypothetical protein